MQPVGDQASYHLRPYASWSDESLVQLLRQDDEQAFAEIYQRYGLSLFEQAFRKVNSREAAEEIVQELFITLWLRRETTDIRKLREYLGTAVKYLVINLIKNKLTHAGYMAYCRTVATEADDSTQDEIAAADLSWALHTALADLPGQTREVFQLSRLEHQTVPQIAVRLKLSPKAVEYHLTRALKLLRVALKDYLLPMLLFLLHK